MNEPIARATSGQFPPEREHFFLQQLCVLTLSLEVWCRIMDATCSPMLVHSLGPFTMRERGPLPAGRTSLRSRRGFFIDGPALSVEDRRSAPSQKRSSFWGAGPLV